MRGRGTGEEGRGGNRSHDDAEPISKWQAVDAKDQTPTTSPPPHSAGFRQQFEFVEGLNSHKGAGRKKTRSFVTKQHYRKKKFERGKDDGAGGERDDFTAGDGSKEQMPEHGRGSSVTNTATATDIAGRYVRGEVRVWNPAEAEPSSQTPSSATLLERLGGGRADPFNSYPVPATKDVHELVDHYYFVIPSLIHKHWSRAIRHPRSCWDLFNLYRHHEIPFLGMLHHAAQHLAGLRGLDVSLQTIEFKHQSLVAVNKSLQRKNGPCDDWTIIGVGLLANAERVWGDRQVARMHWGALKRILLERGGFPALKDNPTMHTKLVWSFIALSWPTANGNPGSPAYVDGFSESVVSQCINFNANPRSAFEKSCQEFAEFFKRRKAQVLKDLPSTPQQQYRFSRHKYRTATFRDGANIRTALCEAETGYANPDKRRAVDNCRMACLIHLNLIMEEFGDLSESTEEYLVALHRILEDDDDDSNLSAEHLLWTLLTPFKLEGHFERTWKTSRLVGVVKRTNPQTWSIIERALRTFLQMPEQVRDLQDSMQNWKEEDFLREAALSAVDDAGSEFAGAEGLLPEARYIPCSDDCQICPLKPPSF